MNTDEIVTVRISRNPDTKVRIKINVTLVKQVGKLISES
jgi:hypothetical protein